MKKKFVYCENTDGGMDTHEFEFEVAIKEFPLFGWMNEQWGCVDSDKGLLSWANSCKIGDFYSHRMGVCFRVNL